MQVQKAAVMVGSRQHACTCPPATPAGHLQLRPGGHRMAGLDRARTPSQAQNVVPHDAQNSHIWTNSAVVGTESTFAQIGGYLRIVADQRWLQL